VKNQVLPAWDADLAERVRPGLTLAELENEVQQAVEGDRDSQTESIRNDALAKALYEITFIKKVCV
jgi:FKBP-type peptidyl-prolyl cis-trans isomerase (trigger factor)